MNLLIVTGGRHQFHETTPILEDFLKAAGHQVTVTRDAGVLVSTKMNDYDALVFNTRRGHIAAALVRQWADEPPDENDVPLLTKAEEAALARFVAGGKGFVSIHISSTIVQGFPEYHHITGGGWISGFSTDTKYGPFTVNLSNPNHACAGGIADFVTTDELYYNIAWHEGNDVFLTGVHEGEPRPLAWTRRYKEGKVFNTLLGHNTLSVQTPEFQRIVLNGVNWVTSRG